MNELEYDDRCCEYPCAVILSGTSELQEAAKGVSTRDSCHKPQVLNEKFRRFFGFVVCCYKITHTQLICGRKQTEAGTGVGELSYCTGVVAEYI